MRNDKSVIIFKDHAIIRMLERGISKNDIIETLDYGEIIEDYSNDFPYPSCLMFKLINNNPLHIIVANNKSEDQKIIITAYIPDSTNFEADFKTRKK